MADKVIVDCSTGEERTEPLTQADEDDRAARAQNAADAQAAREAEEQAWFDALHNANSLADLKAVLAGDAGVGRAARRPQN